MKGKTEFYLLVSHERGLGRLAARKFYLLVNAREAELIQPLNCQLHWLQA